MDNETREILSPPPPDWIEVTERLYKYAYMLDIKDIMAMDQSCAIYFQFAENKEDADCKTQYLLFPPPDSGFQDPAGLTLRELVVFFCWRGLRGYKVDMQTFDDKGKGLGSVAERYSDIRKPADPFPKPHKRPGNDGGHEGRRVLPRWNTEGRAHIRERYWQ